MTEKNQMTIERYFSRPAGDVYQDPNSIINYEPRDVVIKDDSGNEVERISGAVFPKFWGQLAANTVATKYFRKEGVPDTGKEKDLRQLVGRVSGKISEWGAEQKYFSSEEKEKFEQEIAAILTFQYGTYNSPVEFSLGVDRYETKKGDIGYTIQDGKVVPIGNYYANPQISACFIVSPEDSIDSMIEVGAVVSSRIFKGGSGIGGDWSSIRSAGEPITGGGVASGAVRFMDVEDATGRVIKSGGKTRRAAIMQSIAVWHADMIDILKHKYKEEEKARILIEAGSPSNWESHTIQNLRAQNVNISIRTDNKFWEAYEKGENYSTRQITDGKIVREEPARDLATKIAFAAHNCGDPGIQNHDIINRWNTCKNSGEIWASNPCSEYMFLNNTSCNLASLNLMRFRKTDGSFDTDSFIRAVDLMITSQDILVSKASYPLEKIAENSHNFRPLGLGYANLGAYVMSLGLSYDSEEARDFASAVTSLMTAEAYLQSTRLAEQLNPFNEFEHNKEPMLKVIEMHRNASKKIKARNGLENILSLANSKWDEVVERGNRYGFRNSQVTLLAPTGTIGFMMGCDTTGCEPSISLKSYKELAGGGSMIIVNETVSVALDKLGYNKSQIKDIVDYIDKNETIEGAPELKEEHLPIFDCAYTSGKGKRVIAPMGHIRMLGAVQPFLSGAISKTVNCPNNTSVEEIREIFYQGWKHGIKAVAVYRDGSKASQPLKTKKTEKLQILIRGEREHVPKMRSGLTQKVKIGTIPLFLTTGEYNDGRLGELFLNSFERGTEVNRLLNENAIQFSEKLQYGVPLKEALEVFAKAGLSQIVGSTDHPFITEVRGVEDFLFRWISAHYFGDIALVSKKEPELRPLPWELRAYQRIPKLHLIPSVAGEGFYPGVPTLEQTIEKISGMNYWEDSEDQIDTRQTIERIRRTRQWKDDNEKMAEEFFGMMTGRTCEKCGTLMLVDGNCQKCPHCKISTGGCGGR
jgi:ribonucleoside-diphosphate reductase alpha chain